MLALESKRRPREIGASSCEGSDFCSACLQPPRKMLPVKFVTEVPAESNVNGNQNQGGIDGREPRRFDRRGQSVGPKWWMRNRVGGDLCAKPQ